MQTAECLPFQTRQFVFTDRIDIGHLICRVLIQADVEFGGLDQVCILKRGKHILFDFDAQTDCTQDVADMLQVRRIPAVGQENRLALAVADAGIVQIDIDHGFATDDAVVILITPEADQERSALMKHRDVVGVPTLLGQKEIFALVEAK